jgi:hypothetical protein
MKKIKKSTRSKKIKKTAFSFHSKKKQILKRKKILHLAAKIHASITLLAILLYTTLGVFGGPEFFLRDFSNKYKAIAATGQVTLSLRVVGPPIKPVVSAVASCDGSDPVVNLDWEETNDTDNYDIYRNTLPLIAGITDTEYQDTNVQPLMNYDYYVIANGPYGSTASDVVSVSTPECFISTTPTCVIQTINGKNFSSYHETPQLTDRTPRFSGTTNMANALITIDIIGETNIHATLYANSNGYWAWTVPDELKFGSYDIFVTATDPGDPTKTASDTKKFKIVEEEHEKKPPSIPPVTPPKVQPPITPPEIHPIEGEIRVEVNNPEKTVYTGEDLQTTLKIKIDNKETRDMEVTYTITDKDGNVIMTWTEKVSVTEEKTIDKNVTLPKLIKAGAYKIEVKSNLDDKLLVSEDYFQVKEKVILKLGGGTTVTLTQIMENLSWLIIFSLLFLLLFLILLIIEHHLSKQAIFHITEEYLRDKGLISKRKGVSQ